MKAGIGSFGFPSCTVAKLLPTVSDKNIKNMNAGKKNDQRMSFCHQEDHMPLVAGRIRKRNARGARTKRKVSDSCRIKIKIMPARRTNMSTGVTISFQMLALMFPELLPPGFSSSANHPTGGAFPLSTRTPFGFVTTVNFDALLILS